MKTRIRLVMLLAATSMLAASPLSAAEGEVTVETRLREGLRNTMLQLREAQNQVATLQAAQVTLEQKNKELADKLDTMTKQAIADRNASANLIAELNTKITERDTVITGYQAAFDKWKRSYGEATALAQKKEHERAKFEALSIKLTRQVQDQKVRNLKMFETAMEVLARYESFGLGDAILAREPFVGTTRVKFQNLMQDSQDKLADQRIQP